MVLDDPDRLVRLDRHRMLDLVQRFGPMLVEGWEAAAGVADRVSPSPPVVVVAGLGGSAIGGDLLRALLGPDGPVVLTAREAGLPALPVAGVLMVACSYSGDTEETLAAYEAARARGLRPIAVTSGGALAGRAQHDGAPLVRLPGGLPPRAALPLMLGALLRIAHASGVASPGESELREAAELAGGLAGAWGPTVPAAANAAKRLAAVLAGTLPVVYAGSALTAPVAYRWRTQINENAKWPALAAALPEAAHNDVEAWGAGPPDAPARSLVVLRDAEDGPRGARRLEAVLAVAAAGGHTTAEVRSQGDGRPARLLSLVLFGDLVSVYLAVLRGVDPTPVAAIEEVKRRTAGA